MAKVQGGLLSMSASGAIGKSVVFSDWKGVKYARQYVIGKNPRSIAQTTHRNTFKFVHDIYKMSPTDLRDPWEALAKTGALTGGNSFMSHNLSHLSGEADLALLDFCDGANGGIPPSAIEVTEGAGQLTIVTTNPGAPPGWTIDQMTAAVIQDQEPSGEVLEGMKAGHDSATFDSVVITGLTNTKLYRVAAWLVWTKPDGKKAYSSALNSSGTPHT